MGLLCGQAGAADAGGCMCLPKIYKVLLLDMKLSVNNYPGVENPEKGIELFSHSRRKPRGMGLTVPFLRRVGVHTPPHTCAHCTLSLCSRYKRQVVQASSSIQGVVLSS